MLAGMRRERKPVPATIRGYCRSDGSCDIQLDIHAVAFKIGCVESFPFREECFQVVQCWPPLEMLMGELVSVAS